MEYLDVLAMLFVSVCLVSGLSQLADIAASLRGIQRHSERLTRAL